ncbi:MAG: hypothetical protein ACXQTS_06495 [Candidatus Methanospirareceae archaeon]
MEEVKEEVREEVKEEAKAKVYKCRYCGEEFDKQIRLAQHVKAKHPRRRGKKKREEMRAAAVPEEINKAIEAIGILRGLQVAPHLSDGEKKILSDVSKRIEELLVYITETVKVRGK